MSCIDNLIAELCPGGVPFRPLGELGDLVRGNGMPKSDFAQSGVGCIHYGEIYTHYGVSATATKSFVAAEKAAKLAKVDPGDLVITNTSENIDDVCKAVAWLGGEQIVTGGHATVLKHQEDPKFLSYYFQTERFSAEKKKRASGTKVVDVSAKALATIRIPVPPLKVQHEIVKVLDTFTELQAELEAELEARKEQRQALTRFLPGSAHIRSLTPNGVERVRIGEVATQSVEPVRVQPDETYVNLGVHWYGQGVFARRSRPGGAIKGSVLYRARPGQFIYNRMFVIEGSFGVVTPELEGGVVSNEFPVYDLDQTRVLPAWLVLYLLDDYTLNRVAAEVTGVERGSMKSRRRWKEGQFEAFQIDLPSVAAQREALRILDLCVNLESVLRDEGAARRQQYGYFLDKLLTFEERVA